MAKRYLLDTNICVFCLRGLFDIVNKIEYVGIDNCYLSEITIAELYYGAEHSTRPEKTMQQTEEFISLFNVIPSFPALHTFGKLKASLARCGEIIENFDLMIGACAVTNNFILVTDNLKHLSRIPHIKIENWKTSYPL